MNICFRSGCDHVLEPRDFPFLFFFPFPFFLFSTRSLNRCSNDAERMRARARKVAHGNIVFLFSLYVSTMIRDYAEFFKFANNYFLAIIISIFDAYILYVCVYIYVCARFNTLTVD